MTRIGAFLFVILLLPIQSYAQKLSAFALNLDDKKVVLAQDEATSLTPASTAKLFSIYQSLNEFGPDFSFKYEGYLNSESDLIMVIPPDPLFTTEFLYKLVEKIKALGIPFRSIILDISRIQGGRYRVGTRAYESAARGVFFNFNSIEITVCPYGKRIAIETFPTWAGFSVSGSVTKGDETSLKAECRGVQCVVSGTIDPNEGCQSIYRSVDEPETYLQRSFTRTLKEAGILVSQGVKVVTTPIKNNGSKVLTLESRPLYDALRAVAHVSTNVIAEAIVFLNGYSNEEYSYKEGINAIQKTIKEFSKSSDNLLVDGSGLSHENKLSAQILVTLLKSAFENDKINYDFISLLPVGGKSGTLRTRDFGEATEFVRAKTGSLDGVSALAGFVKSKSGAMLAFAILQNEISNPAEAKKKEEELVERIYLDN